MRTGGNDRSSLKRRQLGAGEYDLQIVTEGTIELESINHTMNVV